MTIGPDLWYHLLLVLLAFVLSSAIGYERQLRQKSAGLRTHTLVGLGSALFMLVSKYGFFDVLGDDVRLDPSRIAAGIVSGIGFIGGGLIFVRRDAVRGLTTASTVWVTAAIGAAAGAGMIVVAVVGTAAHFIVTLGYTPWSHRMPQAEAQTQIRFVYAGGTGALRRALVLCTRQGLRVGQVTVEQGDSWAAQEYGEEAGGQRRRGQGARGREEQSHEEAQGSAAPVSVLLQVFGGRKLAELAEDLGELEGVISVSMGETGADED